MMGDRKIVVITKRSALGRGANSSPVAMAEVRKTKPFQTTGVEWPRPGIFVFQRMFVSSASFHNNGGVAAGATPVPNGPRHCGQLSIASAANPSIVK